jgi:peptidoglycan/LPS O-acetylase OafA/YrhL
MLETAADAIDKPRSRDVERRSPPLRLPQLDGLRGVAAFIVVLHHAYLCMPENDPARRWLAERDCARILALGRPAVILFFVLSGFVLTMSLSGSRLSWPTYALRRGVRLLPPFWVAVALSFVASAMTTRRASPSLSSWFNQQWAHSIPSGDLVGSISLLANSGNNRLDHVVWSLVHEFRLSLVLPVFVLAARRVGVMPCLAIAAAVSIGADGYIDAFPAVFQRGYHGFLFDVDGLGPSLVVSARFLVDFAIGAALALSFERVLVHAGKRQVYQLLLGVSGLALLSSANEYAMAVGAAMLIAAIATSNAAARAFAFAPLAWLGRVSYSLYLVHLPIILALGHALDGAMPLAAMMALSIAAGLVAADLMYRCVEEPTIRLGRRLRLPATLFARGGALPSGSVEGCHDTYRPAKLAGS